MIATVENREGEHIYLSNWYTIGGTLWTIVIVVVSILPWYQFGLGQVAVQAFFMHNAVGLWFTPLSLGVFWSRPRRRPSMPQKDQSYSPITAPSATAPRARACLAPSRHLPAIRSSMPLTPAEHITTVLHGLSGKTINGQKYEVEMTPFADKLSDQQIADIIDHERSSWGNHGPLVAPADVAKIRAKK
jgi:hypothetical protein